MTRKRIDDYLISTDGRGRVRMTGSTPCIKGRVIWGCSITACMQWIEQHHGDGQYTCHVRQVSGLPAFVEATDLMIFGGQTI